MHTLKDDLESRLFGYFELFEARTIAVVFSLVNISKPNFLNHKKQNLKKKDDRLSERGLTQFLIINQYASPKHTTAAINGLTFVPVTSTRLSPTTPDTMATMLFNVVIIPNMALRLILLLSSCWA